MSIVTQQTIYNYALAAGFSPQSAQTISAIAMAESGGNTQAANSVGDRGVVQINKRWHPEVSDSCAYDIACSLSQAYRISSNGTNFTPWVTYNIGAYKKFLNTSLSPTSSATNTGVATTTSRAQTISNQQAVQTTMGVSPSLGSQITTFFQGIAEHVLLFIVAIIAIIMGLQFMGADPIGRTGRAVKAIAPIAAA